MTKINLRTYHEEIELLISRGRYDEAVSHCRNILRTYPKSVNTYRMMGKAFLEAKRYTEAIDILQRVLSAIPDDFVSNLGLSIIREDEGNFDAAIWHMDRAYEIQPFNSAIQEELRRLYERRDGSAPPRIRLTRAALARMYAKGNLYQQASAEIRTILAKDPQRLDLNILLANMYLKSGKKVEAAEISSKVLQKLPYSLEANRILVRVLSLSDRKDEIQPYRERLTALDPYEMFTSDEQPQVEIVPDSSVQVEKLDVQSDELLAPGEQADWMTTLGLSAAELDTQLDEELPDWLVAASEQIQADEVEETDAESPVSPDEEFSNTLFSDTVTDIDSVEWLGSPESPPIAEEFPETAVEPDIEEAELPGWMEEAGWTSEGTTQVEAETPEEVEAGEEIEQAEEAEIPDWLKSLAPEEPEDTSTEIDDQMAAILDDSAGEEAQSSSAPEESDEVSGKNVLAGIASAAAGIAAAEVLFGEEDEVIEEPPAEITESDAKQPEPSQESEESELPEWLNEYDTESEISPDLPSSQVAAGAALATELPDWLKEVDESDLQTEEELDAAAIDEQSAESEFDAEVAQAETETTALNTLEEEGADWQEIAQEQEPTEAVSDGEVELPEWLTEIESTDVVEGTSEVEAGEADIPEWLEEIDRSESVEEAPAAEEVEADLPEWLVEFEEETQDTSETHVSTEQVQTEAQPAEEIPEWLKELQAEEETSTELSIQQSENEGISAEDFQVSEAELVEDKLSEEVPDFANADEAMAWLAGLAATQVESESPSEEEIPTGAIDVPERTQEIVEPEIQTEPPIESQPKQEIELESPPDFDDADSALAWLESLAALEGIEESEDSISPDVGETVVADSVMIEEAEMEIEDEQVLEPEQKTMPTQEETPLEPGSPTTEETIEKIDLNSASLVEIERLPGVGYRVAQSIVAYRESNGNFYSLDELSNVPGVDPEDIFSLQPYVYLEPQSQPAPVVEQKSDQGRINAARQAASAGEPEKAIGIYSELIQAKTSLEEVIFDLNQALHTRPDDYELWQLLGDAYMRNDQMIEAMQAYNKAEELLS